MAVIMIRPLTMRLSFILGCSLVAAAFPHALRAQLVRENAAPPQQVSAKPGSQNPASAQTPQGKKRLSQEVQLTGKGASCPEAFARKRDFASLDRKSTRLNSSH